MKACNLNKDRRKIWVSLKQRQSSLGGTLADQWLEVIEPEDMSDQTVMTKGVMVRKDDKRGSNRKGTSDVITDGSVVHVCPNMMDAPC